MLNKCFISLCRIIILCAIIIVYSHVPVNAELLGNMIAYDLPNSIPENSRNTEGSFVTLKNGNIILAYTQFYGGAKDHSASQVAAIESKDNGLTPVIIGNSTSEF